MGLELRSASRLANEGASLIEDAFGAYLGEFERITQRAEARFAQRDWSAGAADAAQRLDVYPDIVHRVATEMNRLHDDRALDPLVWAATKAVYSGRIADRHDRELAETFFNSITRRVFATVGVDPDVEFVATDFALPPDTAHQPVFISHDPGTSWEDLVARILHRHGPRAPYCDLRGDAVAAADRLRQKLGPLPRRAEMLRAVFYRRKGAYVVGRLEIDGAPVPLVLALVNTSEGMVLDTVLTAADDVSILFGFTRSHFHVDLTPAHAVVGFLRTLVPTKRMAELYIAIGHHKHGKTELYRDLIDHLSLSDERFDLAPGTPGLVMVTFAIDDYDLVFKVIRDRFPPQKRTTRRVVEDKYRMVFRHDRAGRLVEAQEFEHLRLDRSRFTPELLDELLAEAGQTVHIDNGHVVIDHTYVERRVTPLDLYLHEPLPEDAREIVVDYGGAIEDLACTGIFPGDLLLKNFGVTRHGRVVSYDYDEITLMRDVNFRDFPTPSTLEEELAAEPWFAVGPDDVFPEEFRSFLGLGRELRAVFEEHCGHLFTSEFWLTMQERLEEGEIVDILPYRLEQRLSRHSFSQHPSIAAS